MAIDNKTPQEIAQDYLTKLKSIKPEVNTSQTDNDWWIKAQVIGGVSAGYYADNRLIANDAFPQKARHAALERFLDLYFSDTFKEPTAASGYVTVYGQGGDTVQLGQQFVYEPTANTYQAVEEVPFDGATAVLVPVVSVDTGQEQNLLSGAPLTVSSPPGTIETDAAASGDISSGRDAETDSQAAARILSRIRFPPAGGTAEDYRQWAIAANDSVVDASVIRFYQGLGTVGVVVTAGTTDIDTALNEGQPIVVIPSDALVEIVQDYVNVRKPLTDCAFVLKPASVGVDVTAQVRFKTGDINTVLEGQTLTQGELVEREIERAIYKTPPGGRQIGGTGFVLASEIEEVIDLGLSSSPYAVGELEILVDRQIENLSVTGPNLVIGAVQVPVPGVITVEEMED